MKCLIFTAAALGLVACASRPEAPSTPGAPKTQASASCVSTPITGSRFPTCTTPNLVRTIGKDNAQDDGDRVRSLSNITGAVSN